MTTLAEKLDRAADDLNMAATTLRAGPASAEVIQAVRQHITLVAQRLDDLQYEAKRIEGGQMASGPITDLKLL